MSNHDQIQLLVEFVVRMKLQSAVQPVIKKSYGSKIKIQKLDNGEIFEPVFPKDLYIHPVYKEWISTNFE